MRNLATEPSQLLQSHHPALETDWPSRSYCVCCRVCLVLCTLLLLLQGSCFQRRGPAGTSDYWIKLPGLALVNANCFCYALDIFQGAQ